MKKLFLTIAVFCFIISLKAQDDNLRDIMKGRGEYVFAFNFDDVADLNDISRIVSIDKVDNGVVTAYANEAEYERFLALNIEHQLVMPEHLLKDFKMFDGSRAEYEWDAYPTYSAYEDMMYQFAEDHPDKCSIIELGTLSSGHKILVARLNDGTTDGEPKFLYSSTMHGDECTGFVMMLRLIDYLLTTDDAQVNNLINNLDIFICPNANPDGTYRWTDDNVNTATRDNASGIDLNRNYPDSRVGEHPDGNEYAAETQLFLQLASDYQFVMAANYHGGSEVLNYPWDNYYQVHADNVWWKYVCHEYADLTHLVDPNYMTDYDNGIVNGFQWYMITGSRQDYMNYYAACREVTIECSTVKIPDESQLPSYWNKNKESMLTYMGEALKGIHGVVTDSLTGEPLEVEVFVEDHDKVYSKIYSNLPLGDFHRVINGGNWTLKFSAEGYKDKYVEVAIEDGGRVDIDVAMVLSGSSIDENEDDFVKVYPNPTEELLNITVNTSESIRWSISDVSGRVLMTGEADGRSEISGVDVSSLNSGIYILEVKSDTFSVSRKIAVR